MMNLWSNNMGDVASNVISSSSAATGLPASNVANNQPTVIWQSGITIQNEYILYDFGGALSLTDFICAFHNFLQLYLLNEEGQPYLNEQGLPIIVGGPSPFTLQYGNDPTIGSFGLANPAGSISVPYPGATIQKNGNLLFLQASFAPQTARYWCFVFRKFNITDIQQIGRIYLGTSVQVNPPDFQDGVQILRNDLSIINTSKGGQDYGLLKPTKRLYTLTWTNAADSDYQSMDTIYARGGKVLKFFMQLDPQNLTGSTDLNSIIYVRFNDDPQNLETDALDAEQCWDMEYDLMEQI